MASYEKLTLVLLGLVLVWHNVRAGYTIQALSLVLTMRAVLKESSSENVLLLMPFLFLGERCLNATLALGHSPLPFYSAALFSYTASFPRSGTWPMDYWCAFGAGSGGLLAVLTGKPTLAIGMLAQFVVGGLTIFACSRKSRSADDSAKSSSSTSKALTSFGHKNRREVLLVASIVASLVLDVFANSNVGTDLVQDSDASAGGAAGPSATNGASIANQLKLTQITSFTHIAGRTSLVCACIITLVAAVLFSRLLAQAHPQLPSKPRNSSSSMVLRSVLFLMLCVGIVGSAGLYVSSIMEENALLWLWAYLHSRKLRLYALLLWVTGIPLAVLGFHLFASKSSLPQTIFRKLYHALAVVAFLPVALLDPSFLAFSIAVATALIVMLECARCLEIYGTKWVTRFVEHQIDERDGGIVRTHVYLIFGFGLSIFFRHRSELVMSRPTPFPLVMACDLIPGLIGLGVVDAMAAVMGTRAAAARKVALKTPKNSVAPTTLASVLCGKWFSGLENAAMQRKTVTGCCWGFLCGSLIWVLILLGLFGPVVLMSRWLWVGIGSIAAATWWEGVCNGVDNLELPLFVYATVMAIGTFGLRA